MTTGQMERNISDFPGRLESRLNVDQQLLSAGVNKGGLPSLMSTLPEPTTIQAYDLTLPGQTAIQAFDVCEELDFLGDFGRDDRWRESMRHRNTEGISHGFSFGERSFSLESSGPERPPGKEDVKFGKVDPEDEGISEVYQGEDEVDEPAPSPVVSRRQVFSQRIGHVGYIGQNLGLGHRIGIMADDAELLPRVVVPEVLRVRIDQDSDTQTDIRWAPSKNSGKFRNLAYDVEACVPGGESKVTSLGGESRRDVTSPGCESWRGVTSCYHTVFRIYHTEDKMFVGKLRIERQESDVTVLLRVRARGEFYEDGDKNELVGDWCEPIVVTFAGFVSFTQEKEEEVQTTNL